MEDFKLDLKMSFSRGGSGLLIVLPISKSAKKKYIEQDTITNSEIPLRVQVICLKSIFLKVQVISINRILLDSWSFVAVSVFIDTKGCDRPNHQAG